MLSDKEKKKRVYEVRDNAYITVGMMDCKKALIEHDWNVEKTLKSIKENPSKYSSIGRTI